MSTLENDISEIFFDSFDAQKYLITHTPLHERSKNMRIETIKLMRMKFFGPLADVVSEKQ